MKIDGRIFVVGVIVAALSLYWGFGPSLDRYRGVVDCLVLCDIVARTMKR